VKLVTSFGETDEEAEAAAAAVAGGEQAEGEEAAQFQGMIYNLIVSASN